MEVTAKNPLQRRTFLEYGNHFWGYELKVQVLDVIVNKPLILKVTLKSNWQVVTLWRLDIFTYKKYGNKYWEYNF